MGRFFNRPQPVDESWEPLSTVAQTPALEVETWAIDRLVFYARNPRKNDDAVDRMCASIREFGFKIPVLARSDGEVVDGHLRLKAARRLGMTEVPVLLCDEWTPEQVKAFRLMVNRSVSWAAWDEELLSLELRELEVEKFDLALTGFDAREIDDLVALPDEERANAAPPPPENPVSRLGDLWLCGPHRVLCGDSTSAEAVNRLLAGGEPLLMTTDPPYGVKLDTEWRDRVGLNTPAPNHRGVGAKRVAKSKPAYPAEASYMKRETGGREISDDTKADWSDAFGLVPSLQVAYVWHAMKYTREVLDGLLGIGFQFYEEIIWDKQRTVLSHTLYWLQHERCWFVRKKNAPWYGKSGHCATIWSAPAPKMLMGSTEEKQCHPAQKPVELMRRPILNHTRRGELIYDPFLGSGTTLAAAQLTERVCCGLELEPKYVDVIVERWQGLTGEEATLEGDGRTFSEIRQERTPSAPADE